MLLLAAAVVTVAALASCSKDGDDTPKNPEPEPVIPHVKYLAKFGEDLFEYAEVTVTIHCNGKDKVYKMDETTKVEKLNMKLLDLNIVERPINTAGRVLKVSPIPVYMRPVKVTTDVKITEEGKQKIAQATAEDKMDFIAYLNFGLCNQNGYFFTNQDRTYSVVAAGVQVQGLETYISVQCEGDEFNCTFK